MSDPRTEAGGGIGARAGGERTGGKALPTPAERRAAAWAGWFMAITFITSIPALILYDPVLNDTSYILGAGSETRIQLAAFMEILLMISAIGVAVVMFPILRRQSEGLALGYVASRIIESAVIGVGLISLLSILTLREDLATSIGAGGSSLEVTGEALVAVHDWTFLLGPGFCVGVNGLLLGYLMYRSGLMPPRLAMFGVIGGPLAFISSTAVLFGAFDQSSAPAALLTVSEIVFEASFAIYLIVKGFRPSHLLTGPPAA